MKKLMTLLSVLLISQTVAIASAEEGNAPAELMVSIVNSKGEEIGNAHLKQQADKVFIHLEAKGLTPGVHGIHFHAEGKCDPPDFKTAGDHFNPHHKQHGFKNPKGFHSGDLPNIKANADGTVTAILESETVTLLPGKPNSLVKEGGTSLIIHEKADDYVTDPSGNSGARIACGVIK